MSLPGQRVVPALRITNYQKSKAFYVEQLGFRIEWEHRFEPSFPVFMEINRDGMRFYLTEHSGDCQGGGLVHFVIEDVDALHRELQGRGVRATEPPNRNIRLSRERICLMVPPSLAKPNSISGGCHGLEGSS